MDLTGPSAAVGPDGFVDDEIQLTTANANLTINSVQISLNGFTSPRWESAPDLDGYSNAEVIDVSGSAGKTYDVFFNPFGTSGPSLQTGQGQQLSVNVYYTDQSGQYTDNLTVPVGSSDPTLTTTLSAPVSITWNGFTASWSGQDTAQNGGKVHVAVAGLAHPILGAALSDQFANNSSPSYWTYGTLASSSPPSGALYVTQTGATADIAFAPLETEAGTTLTLRLDFGSYGQQAAQFLGESCDPGLTVANIQETSKTETPGTPNSDFLQADANNYGTIYLSTGTYYMDQQLILNQPVTICPAPGASATLVFSQPQSSTTPNVWSDAIEIKSSHVTLQGFSIQFMGSFLWTTTGGSSTGVINTYNSPIDVTISGMNIQGPTQSLFDQATDPGASVPTSQVLADTFTTNTLGSEWTVLGGTWTEGNGTLSQTANGWDSGTKKVLVNSTTPYPGAEQIEANVRLDSIAGDGRAGVSLDNDSNGNGYNLVFHQWTNGLAVQLLNDSRDWSSVAIYTDSNGNPWQLSTYYTFKLVVVPQGDGVDALFGKVWLSGTGEPAQWTIEEIQGSGRSRSPGLPALEGGSSGNGGYATADFQPVNGTTGSLVWAVTPDLFSAVDSTRWQSLQGTWSQSNGVFLQSSTSSTTNKQVIFPMAGTAPSSMMITAEVTPAMNLGDPNLGASTVGVGLDTDSTGNGYELAFVKDGSSLGVQLRDGTTSGQTYTTDSLGNPLQTGVAYGMQLMVLHEPDGTDSVFGMVWPWAPDQKPQYWTMWVGGWSHALGSPSLDGGSSGDATAQFSDVQVTAATTSALPLINMETAHTGSVTGNTLTGGTLLFSYGPWQITGNTYNGAVAGTFVQAAFTFFTGHGRNLSGNTVSQLSPYGKTVRLLDVGNSETWASNDVVSDNTVVDSEGMATRPGDWGWDQNVGIYDGTNQGEFILFESYDLAYEGSLYTLSGDGRELKIPYAQGVAPSMSDVVSILNGPDVGQWFQIAQVIQSPTSQSDPSYTLLMDSPLPLPTGANYAISIDEGFVNETLGSTTPGQGNTIDIRGSGSNLFSLDGFQFGTRVLNNYFAGNNFYSDSGAQGYVASTYSPFMNPNNPGQTSLPWGWTHTPEFGIQIDGNTFVDLTTTPADVSVVGVDHSQYLHSNVNRRYFTGQIENNVFVYSNPPAGSKVTAVQLGIDAVNSQGQSEAADPYELSLIASNNTEIVPATFSSQGWNVVIPVVAGTVNGLTTAQTINLPGSTTPAQVNLAPYYNQVGLSSDNATGHGNLDGGGYSYSANALGGGIINWQGVPFVLGPAGQNNVVQAAGQTIPLPSGNYTALLLIGTAVQGGKTGTITMHYTDGSTSVVTQEFSDWAYDSSNPGEYVVRTMSYRNYSQNNGLQTLTMYAYGYSLPITPGKTLQSVTLPTNADIYILSMDLVGPQSQVSLSSLFNQVGLTSDDDTDLGSLDGLGYSYSIDALGGAAVAWAGTTFNLGSAGQNNVVAANNQTVVLPGGKYTALQLLGASVFGPQRGTFTVHYSDGTSSTFTQSFSDWAYNTSQPGESVVESMDYRNFNQGGGNGRDTRSLFVYGYSFALNPSKQVVSVTFPANSAIKILAMDLVSQPTQSSLANNDNLVGLTSDTGPTPENLDGAGTSDSKSALAGGTVAWVSNSFNLGGDAANNVVQATGQTILLQPGKYSTLRLMATAAKSIESGTFTIHDSGDGLERKAAVQTRMVRLPGHTFYRALRDKPRWGSYPTGDRGPRQ